MGRNERKLTLAELERKEFFDAKSKELTREGYVRKDLTINIVKANILAIIIMIPLIVLFLGIYYLCNQKITLNFTSKECLFFLISFMILTVIHEGIHGITWAIFAKDHFKAIKFGVIWSALTPYCTCRSELKRWQYVIGTLMPTIILGCIPAIISIITNNVLLLVIALVMIIGGGGDAIIITKILLYKEEKCQCVYIDHPYECGVVVFKKEMQ